MPIGRTRADCVEDSGSDSHSEQGRPCYIAFCSCLPGVGKPIRSLDVMWGTVTNSQVEAEECWYPLLTRSQSILCSLSLTLTRYLAGETTPYLKINEHQDCTFLNKDKYFFEFQPQRGQNRAGAEIRPIQFSLFCTAQYYKFASEGFTTCTHRHPWPLTSPKE